MGASAQILLDPSSASTAQPRVVAAAPAVKFDIGDLNPLKLIYDEVMKQVATDANRSSFAVGTPVPLADFSKMDAQIKLNTEKFQRMNGSANISGLPESGPR